MKQSLLAAGAKHFAMRGVATVSVEELIAEADVSRATFYGLYPSKYSLLEDIVNPVFETATAAILRLSRQEPRAAIEGLIDVYLELWSAHRDGLLLLTLLDAATFRHFGARRSALREAMLAVLGNAERADLLRNGSARYSLKVLARTAIPLLRVYDGHPAREGLFKDALRGLLLRTR